MSASRTVAFDAAYRRRALERMAEDEVDLLVVGGGITGCGIALDAASRGLSVALVEREDFAAGTSGRSSRLIHGGLRYLARGDVRLVREAVRERAIVLRIAPHLVRPLPMFLPLPSRRERAAMRPAFVAYDLLANRRNVARHRKAGAEEVGRAVPGLGRPSEALVYTECSTDDARLTLEIARAAAAHGALVANHAVADALLGDGLVRGARITDTTTGRSLEARARLTVNAAGVWAAQVQGLATSAPRRHVTSKGIHLVFRPGAVDIRVGTVVRSVAGDGRFVLVIPWEGRVYAGPTDTAYDGDLDAPAASDEDAAYLLGAVAQVFPGVGQDDVVVSWAGLRPLAGTGGARTADLSRRHVIYEGPPGLLTIVGGKLTTYRAMAEELVDRAVRKLGRGGASRTKRILLGLTEPLDRALALAESDGTALGLPPAVARRVVYRYGDDWKVALELVRQEPELAHPVADGAPVLEVERRLARTRELALTDEDVDVRRTRLTTLGVRGAAFPG